MRYHLCELLPTDFSENSQVAFERACGLARQLGAKLYLLHIQATDIPRSPAIAVTGSRARVYRGAGAPK